MQNYFEVQIMAQTSSIHVYDHYDLYLTPVTLTFSLFKMFQMALLLLEATSVLNCFEIHALLSPRTTKLWRGYRVCPVRMYVSTYVRTYVRSYVHPL